MNNQQKTESLDAYADLFFEVAKLLMSSGATTSRVQITLNRLKECYGVDINYLITHSSVSLTIRDSESGKYHTRVELIPPTHIDFTMISGISRASWSALDEEWTLNQFRQELIRLKKNTRYARWKVLVMVSMAGAGFCYLFDGSPLNQLVTFCATFLGLFVRQELMKRSYKNFICIYVAALVASSIASCAMLAHIGTTPEMSLATSVLFLVPGIPLINSFCDIIDGNITNGIVRMVDGWMGALALAMGLLTAMIIFNLNLF